MLYKFMCALVAGAVAVSARMMNGRVVVDTVDRSPVDEWKELSRADPLQEITFIVALKRRNIDELHNVLMDVSTPGNARYGDFMTAKEVHAMTRPTQLGINAVKRWLKNGNDVRLVEDISGEGDYLAIHTVIGEAEELLHATYYNYVRVGEGSSNKKPEVVTRIKMGTDYTVPAALSSFVHLVTPTHRFPARSTLRLSTGVGADRVTPTYLRELYNVGDAKAMAMNNSQGIASFQLQYYDKSDLTTFWKDYNVESCTVIDVPSYTAGHELEAELDTQYISSLGEGITMQVWYNRGNFEDALLNWATSVYNDANRPLLFSISYGTTESYYGGSYISKFNEELMMLGSIGVSVLFASGDSGAGGGCVAPPFDPDYPASSPYVTAVGGVHGGTINSQPLGEMAWIDGGGGFSNYAPTQSWQMTAVNSYLTNNAGSLPAMANYNSSGRGYPDISAQSEDFVIVVNGREEIVSGTSCSSPTSGGIFALLNDLRKNAGMSELGFLNPFIYSTASLDPLAFNDCTLGHNSGCALSNGFPAETGWDAASGWGSPDYGELSKHVMKTGEQTKKLARNN